MRNRVCLMAVISCMLVAANLLPVYAADLNAELSSKGMQEKPRFRFDETALVDYHDGGKLRDILYNKNMTISFVADSKNPSVQDLIASINTNLLQEKSLVKVTDLLVNYKASVTGGDSSATFDYSLTLIPTITNYVMTKDANDRTVIDGAWMGISLDGPVIIKTEKYGDLNINNLASFLQKAVPDFNSQIAGTEAEKILSYSMISSTSIVEQPTSNWQSLFDPAYILAETSAWGYHGDKVPISILSLGQTSIGILQASTVHTVDFTLDKKYQIQTIQHASSATIQIDGHADLEILGGKLAFITTPQSSIPNPQEPKLPAQMIYAMAGFGAAIAVGIFIWSNKKMKQTVTQIDTGPVKYETRQHWADRFDGNQNQYSKKKMKRSAI